MRSISGEVVAGEASAATQIIGARQRGSVVWVIMFAFAAYAVAFAIAFLAAELFTAVFGRPPYLDAAVLLAGLIGGWLLYVRSCRPFLNRRFRAQMTRRGLQTRYPYSISIDDAGLQQTSGGLQKTAVWRVVTEAFSTKDHWVFLVQTEPWVAPRRFFADQAEEKAFIVEALAHMSAEARERSPQAAAFAGSSA